MDLSAKMARQIGLLYLRFLPGILAERYGILWRRIFLGKNFSLFFHR